MKIDQVCFVKLHADGGADVRCTVRGLVWPTFPNDAGVTNEDGTQNREKYDEFSRAREAYYREIKNLEKRVAHVIESALGKSEGENQ